MAKQPESKIVRAIRAYITGRGGRCFKIHGGDNPFQEVGIPDLLCCYRGRFLGLEVKQPGGKVSPKQYVVLRSIKTAGGIATVVEGLEEVVDLLAKLDRKRRL